MRRIVMFLLLPAFVSGCSTAPPSAPERAQASASETSMFRGAPSPALASDAATLKALAHHGTPGAPVRNDQIVHVPFFIQDASGNVPASPSTPLFEARQHNPILAPDGHQVTLAEFNRVSGSATVKCVERGTHVVIHLKGLIPNGLYTIWDLTWKAPGFDPAFANLIGLGSLGTPDGSQNALRASAHGEGNISAIIPAGALSVFGSTLGCELSDEFEFHLVGEYHIDGRTYGPDPGPDGSAVEQFGFIFVRP